MIDFKHTNEALNAFAKQVIKQSRSNLTRKGKRVGNTLYDSLRHSVAVHKNSFEMTIEMEDYGDFVDKGVSGKEVKYNTPFSFKNKMPPRGFIFAWIRARRLFLRDDKGQFKKGGQKSLAFLIQRSIFKKGIRPSLFFTKPFEDAFKNLPQELVDSYALDIENLMRMTFENRTKIK